MCNTLSPAPSLKYYYLALNRKKSLTWEKTFPSLHIPTSAHHDSPSLRSVKEFQILSTFSCWEKNG